jgi:hypothetical protein
MLSNMLNHLALPLAIFALRRAPSVSSDMLI